MNCLLAKYSCTTWAMNQTCGFENYHFRTVRKFWGLNGKIFGGGRQILCGRFSKKSILYFDSSSDRNILTFPHCAVCTILGQFQSNHQITIFFCPHSGTQNVPKSQGRFHPPLLQIPSPHVNTFTIKIQRLFIWLLDHFSLKCLTVFDLPRGLTLGFKDTVWNFQIFSVTKILCEIKCQF